MSTPVVEIGAFEAKTKLSSILTQVERGKRFYITKHGRRVAEVRPVESRRPAPRFGSGKHLIGTMASDFDAPLDCFKEYMK